MGVCRDDTHIDRDWAQIKAMYPLSPLYSTSSSIENGRVFSVINVLNGFRIEVVSELFDIHIPSFLTLVACLLKSPSTVLEFARWNRFGSSPYKETVILTSLGNHMIRELPAHFDVGLVVTFTELTEYNLIITLFETTMLWFFIAVHGFHSRSRSESGEHWISWVRSAVNGRIVFASVLIDVEVTDGGTIGNVSFYIILHADTVTSGEGSQLSVTSFVPDNTLDETLASANRIEVDLCGGGVESHWLFADVIIIGYRRGQRTRTVTPVVPSPIN